MKSLVAIASEIASLLQTQAEAKAQRAALKIGGGAVALLLLGVSLGFTAFGGFLLLAAEVGPVLAAFLLALIALLAAIVVLLLARHSAQRKKHDTPALTPEINRQLDALMSKAGDDLGKAAPYIVAAGFLAGFLSGRK